LIMRILLWMSAAAVVFALAATGVAQPRGSANGSLPDPRDVPPAECPLQGTAKSQAGQELNQAKNRATAPLTNHMDPAVTLEAMLARGNDENRFDEGKGARITGWVVDVQQGGHPETANCGSMSTLYTDTHITVGLAPDAVNTATLVVEVTPRWREMMMRTLGQDWATETLQQKLIGQRIQFTGWLMFDDDHFCEAVNTHTTARCARSRKTTWRKTVWEIHPITDIRPAQ
jgi:hypothetical protein